MVEIALFEPEIAGNVGNIIRTCMCLNASLSIIGYIPFELSDRTLKRAGMDYAIGFPIVQYPNMEAFDKAHRGIKVFYVTRYSDICYASANIGNDNKDVCLMFGRESTGIPKDVLHAHLESCVRIPMVKEARSLNLANSVAIVLAECQRERGFEGLSETETIKGKDFLKNWTSKAK